MDTKAEYKLKPKTRLENLVQWYNHLRNEGKRMYGDDQSDLAWYAKYNKYNCFRWAWDNSKTHYINGKYYEGSNKWFW